MTDTVSVQDELSGDDQPFIGHILLDSPAVEPVLGFQPIARALATLIQTSEPQFAIGVFGSWGCGKSTLLEAIDGEISRDHAVVVKFNAWRYEREPHLILPLLDTIRDALASWASDHLEGESQATSMARRIGTVVRALARGFSAQIGMPGAVTLSFDTSRALDALPTSSEDVAKDPQSLYFAAFQELSGAFHEIRTANFSRIVVFVDDLDRCLPTSALTVLESMKLFFDMPGFVFVVGLDERVVEQAVWSKFAAQPNASVVPSVKGQVEQEYVKKIFQVPYTMPTMVPGQLRELLDWMDNHGEMSQPQRYDLRNRVRRYLRYVAVEGKINPREIKRFVNAYTLQRMIRPDLNPNTVLALQTLDFRRDWEETSDLLLSEPDVFADALRQYREEDPRAFENLWPELAVLPPELAAYLRSNEAASLTRPDLERYLSSLHSTRGTLPWLHDAIRDVGRLRQVLRDVPTTLRFGSEDAVHTAEELRAVIARLDRYETEAGEKWTGLSAYVQRLTELCTALKPTSDGPDTETTLDQVETWRTEAQRTVDALHQELRLIRRSSAFSAH